MLSPRLVAVVGPTGTGKSDLAIFLASHLNENGIQAEIINADSMQLYKGMNIGTAKLSKPQRHGIKHHLLDVLNVTEESTAAAYQEIARPLIQDLQSQNKVPILVGGSMLYLASVLNNLEFAVRDSDLRQELESALESSGKAALFERLKKLDPETASRVDQANPRRIIRALEVVLLTGKPFAAQLPKEIVSWQPVLEIGLNSERADLVERLAARVESMWSNGIVDEVRELEKVGLRQGKTARAAIGYAQALDQIDGRMTELEAIENTVKLTQRYARRQMSWFRRDERIRWLDYRDPGYRPSAITMLHSWLEE